MSRTTPIINVITDPVLLDKVIKQIQTALAVVDWITFSFGRAFKKFQVINDVKTSYPAIFQAWKKDYYNAYPNDNINKGYSFVFADPGDDITEHNSRRNHNIERDISIIVFYDMEKIDNTLEYPFHEQLKEDVFFQLSTINKEILVINDITDDIEQVFDDFTPSEIKAEFLGERYGAFKFECTVFYRNENCAINAFNP